MNLIKNFIKKIPILFPLLKILQDRRYLYHYLQGFISNKKYRSIFLRAESRLFFKKNDTNFQPILLNNNVNELVDNGFIENPIIINDVVSNEIKDFLRSKLMHDPESNDTKDFLLDTKPDGIKRGFYKCEDVVQSPHVLDIANDPKLLSIAYNYFGAIPTIDYIGSWWSFPTADLALTQSYHRDIDTLNSLKFFIYLTDVDLDSGPHIYVKGSHNSQFKTSKDKMHEDADIIKGHGDSNIISLEGSKGYTFIADTFGFHKGLPPIKNNRLVLQIIYTLKRTPFSPKKPFVNKNDALKLCSHTYSEYVNRNIVRP
jgi:hypothetical protein